MTVYKCIQHQVVVILDGNIRRVEPPPGSFGGLCKLLTMHPVIEGKYNNCEIEKVS